MKEQTAEDVKVSVVVPVYNVEPYLDEAIDSILNQTHKNLEIILVDDGSKDNSPEICDRRAAAEPRIKVVHKKNGGLSSARNAGIEHCTGEYIMFMDSDDVILPEMLTELLEARKYAPEADIIGSSLLPWSDDDKGLAPLKDFTVFTPEEAMEAILEFRIERSACTKLYRRDTMGDLRFEEGRLNEDFPFMIRFYKRSRKILYVPKGYYLYRMREGSITHSFDEGFFHIITNAEELKPELPLECSKVADAYEMYMLRAHIDAAFKIVRNGCHKRFSKYLKKSRRYVRKSLGTIMKHKKIGLNYKVKALLIFFPFKIPV